MEPWLQLKGIKQHTLKDQCGSLLAQSKTPHFHPIVAGEGLTLPVAHTRSRLLSVCDPFWLQASILVDDLAIQAYQIHP